MKTKATWRLLTLIIQVGPMGDSHNHVRTSSTHKGSSRPRFFADAMPLDDDADSEANNVPQEAPGPEAENADEAGDAMGSTEM